ncbi:MAG: PIN domain-containing protein [Endomicrobium sp.]|jgi:predicted nucleic-acid-binding protein|nr:PIN domain-containing protein [Endomicrobium sp.]
MVLVDTNIILRYVLNDHPEHSHKAREFILNNEVMILTQVIAEAIYVLGGVYKADRKSIYNSLSKIIFLGNVCLEDDVIVRLAIYEYSVSKLDFVDALLYAYNKINGMPIETFDKELLKKIQN